MSLSARADQQRPLSRLERIFSFFSTVRAGEGQSILLYAFYVFLILVVYYLLKNIREAFILTEFSSEVRAYAVGAIAVILFFIVPIYNLIFNYTNRIALLRWITSFFVVNIIIFYLLYQAEIKIGFFFFVWVGIFGVLMISQFWAFAADSFNLKAGQRLFPIIMVGAGLGGVVGSKLTSLLTQLANPGIVLLTAAGILTFTMVLTVKAWRTIPAHALCQGCHLQKSKMQNFLGGLAIVTQQPYLRAIAIYVVILNCINSTGEYILADKIFTHSSALLSSGEMEAKSQSALITLFYSDFYFWVTMGGLVMQAFFVSRIYARIGIALSTLVMPVFVLLGYMIIGFIPIFTIIYLFKILENSIDYSIMNTTRQAFFLPLTMEEKYHGKTAIDTFFWRFGDMVQAGIVFAGINYFDFGVNEFIYLSIALALLWIWISFSIVKLYRQQVRLNAQNNAPYLNKAIPDCAYFPGREVLHRLDHDTFLDPDPGDSIYYEVSLSNGSTLPRWLHFDPLKLVFEGQVPADFTGLMTIRIVARDFDGLSANGEFKLYPG